MNDALILSQIGDGFAPLSGTTPDHGVPTRRYHKALIRVGEYVKAAAGERFTVTPELLSHWARTFGQMKANGVEVAMPVTHERAGDPDANRGYVEDLFVEGDTLIGVCRLIGEDALLAAARSDVSIFAPATFTDGKGHQYKRPIVHVALVTDPVIPGLGAFIPLAASLAAGTDSADNSDVLVRSAEARVAQELRILPPPDGWGEADRKWLARVHEMRRQRRRELDTGRLEGTFNFEAEKEQAAREGAHDALLALIDLAPPTEPGKAELERKLIESILDKPIDDLGLSHNAAGDVLVKNAQARADAAALHGY